MAEIWWDEANNIVGTNWMGGTEIWTPAYAAPSIAFFLLEKICSAHNYPAKLVQTYLDGNPTKNYCFNVLSHDTDIQAAGTFLEIAHDTFNLGIQKEIIERVRDTSLFDGYNSLCNLLYGIEICDGTA